jgi:hypothetical protein
MKRETENLTFMPSIDRKSKYLVSNKDEYEPTEIRLLRNKEVYQYKKQARILELEKNIKL